VISNETLNPMKTVPIKVFVEALRCALVSVSNWFCCQVQLRLGCLRGQPEGPSSVWGAYRLRYTAFWAALQQPRVSGRHRARACFSKGALWHRAGWARNIQGIFKLVSQGLKAKLLKATLAVLLNPEFNMCTCI